MDRHLLSTHCWAPQGLPIETILLLSFDYHSKHNLKQRANDCYLSDETFGSILSKNNRIEWTNLDFLSRISPKTICLWFNVSRIKYIHNGIIKFIIGSKNIVWINNQGKCGWKVQTNRSEPIATFFTYSWGKPFIEPFISRRPLQPFNPWFV